MRIVLGLLVFAVGCGGKASESSTHASSAGAGGNAGASVDAGADAQAGGGSAGQSCDDLQAQAQRAADTSCNIDSDCVHPPHMAGDCSECGVLLNAASEESSLAAVSTACKSFFAQGCKIAMHSCPYEPAICDAGVCGFGILRE